MLFNSLQFAVFFPVVTLLYFLLPHRFRWLLLLTASCMFYMAFIPLYILILAFTIVIDYFAGLWIEGAVGPRRRLLLLASLIANIGTLALFKYYHFIENNIAGLARLIDWNYAPSALSIILPIGLSFHTFQAMSYTIEVYRGRWKAERHFGTYALYVMFYPQLVAGPIERPQNLLRQFREEHVFDYDRVTSGLRLMMWGMFKKVVVADGLAVFVNKVYGSPHDYPGLPLLMGTVFFAIQIYCDFSGYSDIAIGAARVMGFKLMQNFNRPYAAESIAEFWHRWHISLSTWFRDYLYIPLGGNRVTGLRWLLNLSIVFLVSGLWHGANWTFVIWGGLHGMYLIVGILTARIRNVVVNFLGLDGTLLLKSWRIAFNFVLVSIAWVFFRAANLSDAWYILTSMAPSFHDIGAQIAAMRGLGLGIVLPAIVSAMVVEVIGYLHRDGKFTSYLISRPAVIRWAAYSALVLWTVLFAQYGHMQFIYFQF
jgi:D-alanyl-lipoteichoic acid acyltransferase DltB (MBOAT superfamily)